MILTVLSQLHADRVLAPTRVLDVGTGSGILAIAAARLFRVVVDAIDIDTSALDNARDNCMLNSSLDTVHLSATPIEHLTGSYDLILGNLYGEVLVTMEPQMKRLAAKHCTIILSGITDLVRNIVVEEYTRDNLWHVTHEYSEDGWVCLILQEV
jgi:ribosomal protein L11 methyltransferase